MYHFEEIVGLSPDFATVNAAPSELYWTVPCSVKESDADWRLMDVLFPNAGLGGQAPAVTC